MSLIGTADQPHRPAAEAGADVVASGRRIDLVKDVTAEIHRMGRRTIPVAADVSDIASLDRLRDECIEAFGRVDILLAVAGTTKKVPTLEMDETGCVIETNSPARPRVQVGRTMVAQKFAASSRRIAVVVCRPRGCGPRGEQGGRRRLTRALAVETPQRRAGAVRAFGPIQRGAPRLQRAMRTPMKRFSRTGTGGAAVFLSSGAASFVTGHMLSTAVLSAESTSEARARDQRARQRSDGAQALEPGVT
jgi:NAD(P)-dependent dehydrogenase (short-subunit alcohol dehydrogenase family)